MHVPRDEVGQRVTQVRRYLRERNAEGAVILDALNFAPTDTAFNQQTMRDGEVMAVEPGVYVRGFGGFRHSDTLIVGPKGPEILTKFPKDLPSLTIQ